MQLSTTLCYTYCCSTKAISTDNLFAVMCSMQQQNAELQQQLQSSQEQLRILQEMLKASEQVPVM